MYLKRVFDKEQLAIYMQEKQTVYDATLASLRAQFPAPSSPIPDEVLQKMAKETADKAPIQLPKLVGVALAHTGVEPEQTFSIKLVTQLLEAGLMELHEDELILHVITDEGVQDLHYEVLLHPGRYCLHCDQKLDDDPVGTLARLHVTANHKGIPSPSEDQPSGYIWNMGYKCRLNTRQHNKYKVARPALAYTFAEMEDSDG